MRGRSVSGSSWVGGSRMCAAHEILIVPVRAGGGAGLVQRESHFHPASFPSGSESFKSAEVGERTDLASELGKGRCPGNMSTVPGAVRKGVGVVPFGNHHAVKDARVLGRLAQGLEVATAHRAPGRLAVARVPGKTRCGAFLAQHGERLAQIHREGCRGRVKGKSRSRCSSPCRPVPVRAGMRLPRRGRAPCR